MLTCDRQEFTSRLSLTTSLGLGNLQVEKVRLRDMKSPAFGHTAIEKGLASALGHPSLGPRLLK